MPNSRVFAILLVVLSAFVPASRAQLGKAIPIPAGSEEDKQLKAINDASDPAQKLPLIDSFASAHPDGDFAIVADEQYVTYYIAVKQYDKAFTYGDKIFALDPDNFNNAESMVRAASEKGDVDRVFTYGAKAAGILQRFNAAAAPEGTPADAWQQQKTRQLDSIKEDRAYIEGCLLNAAYQTNDPAKRADYLQRFAKLFPDSPNAEQALNMAAFSYQSAQNRPKMLDVANAVLAKNPNDIGMLVLLADDYSEKNEQLDKAEASAKKAITLCDSAKKPDNVSDADWQKQIALQKGLALSALGQIGIEKKDNLSAVRYLTTAAPLLKSNAFAYGRNQYRLGYAYLNLKKIPEARQALTEAASVDNPYKAQAQAKLQAMGAAKPPAKKAA
jgi:tetratricopeptide (TPR) repeat protein